MCVCVQVLSLHVCGYTCGLWMIGTKGLGNVTREDWDGALLRQI